MKQLLPVLALVASVCAGQTADQTPETLASATESRVSALSRQASQLLSPSPKEQELLAACCATAQVQDELRKIGAERLVAMDAVVFKFTLRSIATSSARPDPRLRIWTTGES